MWFELKSSGLPVLAIGLALAMLIPLLFAISIPFDAHAPPSLPFRSWCFAVPIVLLASEAMPSAFAGRQGRMYASAFEATQPYGTAQLAGLKVLVRIGLPAGCADRDRRECVVSSSLLSAWGAWLADGRKGRAPGVAADAAHAIGDAFGGTDGYAIAALVVIASVVVAVMVASLAAFTALRARYPRRLIVAGSLLLLWYLAIVLLDLAARRGIGPEFLLGAILRATGWIAAAAMVFAIVYLFWSGFAERVLTIRYACGAVAISAAFGAAWLTVLHMAGGSLPGCLRRTPSR